MFSVRYRKCDDLAIPLIDIFQILDFYLRDPHPRFPFLCPPNNASSISISPDSSSAPLSSEVLHCRLIV